MNIRNIALDQETSNYNKVLKVVTCIVPFFMIIGYLSFILKGNNYDIWGAFFGIIVVAGICPYTCYVFSQDMKAHFKGKILTIVKITGFILSFACILRCLFNLYQIIFEDKFNWLYDF